MQPAGNQGWEYKRDFQGWEWVDWFIYKWVQNSGKETGRP